MTEPVMRAQYRCNCGRRFSMSRSKTAISWAAVPCAAASFAAVSWAAGVALASGMRIVLYIRRACTVGRDQCGCRLAERDCKSRRQPNPGDRSGKGEDGCHANRGHKSMTERLWGRVTSHMGEGRHRDRDSKRAADLPDHAQRARRLPDLLRPYPAHAGLSPPRC